MKTSEIRKAIKAIDAGAKVSRFSNGWISIRTEELAKVLEALPSLNLKKISTEAVGGRYNWSYRIIAE